MKKINNKKENIINSILLTSGYYCLDKYMKEDQNLYALVLCDEEFVPHDLLYKERIFFLTDNSTEGIIKKIESIPIDFLFLLCIDDKFMDKIDEIKKELNLFSYLIDGPIARDKYILKQKMNEFGIRYPKTIQASNLKELKDFIEEIAYPVIAKPSNSYGSNGVYLVNNKEELREYAKSIFNRNRFQNKYFGDDKGFLLVEEYISGEEFAVDIIWNDGLPKNKMISSRIHAKNTSMFPDYVYYYDCRLEDNMKEKIYSFAEAVGRMVGIKNGATHTEMREKNGVLYILENAVRPGGGGCIYYLHQFHSNQPYYKNNLKTMKGLSFEFNPFEKTSERYYFFMTYPNEKSGIVKEMSFDYLSLDKNIEIFSVDFLIKLGEKIIPSDISMRYTMFVYGAISASCKEEFEEKIEDVYNACTLEID